MNELQNMLRVQARLHRKQGANALGDLFENAFKEIEQLEQRNAELERNSKDNFVSFCNENNPKKDGATFKLISALASAFEEQLRKGGDV